MNKVALLHLYRARLSSTLSAWLRATRGIVRSKRSEQSAVLFLYQRRVKRVSLQASANSWNQQIRLFQVLSSWLQYARGANQLRNIRFIQPIFNQILSALTVSALFFAVVRLFCLVLAILSLPRCKFSCLCLHLDFSLRVSNTQTMNNLIVVILVCFQIHARVVSCANLRLPASFCSAWRATAATTDRILWAGATYKTIRLICSEIPTLVSRQQRRILIFSIFAYCCFIIIDNINRAKTSEQTSSCRCCITAASNHDCACAATTCTRKSIWWVKRLSNSIADSSASDFKLLTLSAPFARVVSVLQSVQFVKSHHRGHRQDRFLIDPIYNSVFRLQ